MKEVAIKDWPSFEAEVTRILDGFEASSRTGKGYISHPLFREQADHRWRLLTRLERFSTKSSSVKSYYRLLLSVAPAVNSLRRIAGQI